MGLSEGSCENSHTVASRADPVLSAVWTHNWHVFHCTLFLPCLSVPHCLCLSSACLSRSQEEMTSALATMRVDYEQIKIKKIEDASNPLLLKRRKKARAVEDAALAH